MQIKIKKNKENSNVIGPPHNRTRFQVLFFYIYMDLEITITKKKFNLPNTASTPKRTPNTNFNPKNNPTCPKPDHKHATNKRWPRNGPLLRLCGKRRTFPISFPLYRFLFDSGFGQPFRQRSCKVFPIYIFFCSKENFPPSWKRDFFFLLPVQVAKEISNSELALAC